MLPALKNFRNEKDLLLKSSFAETFCDGYYFDVKQSVTSAGIRSVFYYKEEHSLLISHVFSNRVHVINLTTGRLRWFDHHGTTVRSVHAINHEIITSSWDGKVCITNFDSLKLRVILTENEMGRCPDATVSPDYKFVYSYSYDSDKNPELTANTIRKWAISDGKLVYQIVLPGYHLSSRRCGSCIADATNLYIVSDTGHLHIYDCETGILVWEDFYNDQLQSLCLIPEFNLIAFAGEQGNIYLCHSSGKRIMQKNNVHMHDISHLFSHPDQPDIMISNGFDGTMKIWKLPDLELLGSVEVNKEHLWLVTVMNDLIITGSEHGDIRIYDITDLYEIKFKGKIVVSGKSFAFVPPNSHSFYASDLSIMQVQKKDSATFLEGHMADYLINTGCNFRIFKDLFSGGSNESAGPPNDNLGFYQIAQ